MPGKKALAKKSAEVKELSEKINGAKGVVIVDYNASVTPYVHLRIRGMLWGLYWLLNVLFSPKLHILTLFVLASAIYKPNDKEVHKHGQYHKDYDSRFVRWKYLVSKDYPKHKFLAFLFRRDYHKLLRIRHEP